MIPRPAPPPGPLPTLAGPTLAVAVLLSAFFLSGFTTLVYEILWTRVVSATFGVTAHAVATTLAAFMAGLALGSFLGGRLAARVGATPLGALGAYAVVEGFVALAALAVQGFLAQSGPLMGWISLTFPGTGFVALGVRFVCLAGILLVPTTLMGATLPLFLQGFGRLVASTHRGITLAYGVNVLGAAAGCFTAAFVLLAGLGVSRSITLAAGLNLLAAVLALAADRWARGREVAPEPAPAAEASLPIDPRLLYGLVAGTGTATLAFEVIWSRVYRQAFLLANPFKGFALVLTMILVGMAVGSLFVSIRKPTPRATLALFGGLQLALALTSLLGIAQLRLALVGVAGSDTVALLLTGATLLVPAILAGACFPTLGSLYGRARATVGSRLGALSFASTAGGVVGSLLGGFVLLPLLGSRLSVVLLATFATTAGWVALRHGVYRGDPDGRGARRTDGLAFGLLVSVGWVWMVTADEPDFPTPPGHTFVWMDDGLEATTVVLFHQQKASNVLYTNGARIETRAQGSRVALPMVLAPRAERVLLIGFGTGSSAHYLLDNFPDVQVDCVEIDGNQIASARLFGTESVLSDPRFTLVVDDGRQYFLRNPGTWDLVVVDTFGQDINQEFYSVGFFEAALGALAAEGTFFIKLPIDSLARPTDADVMIRSAAAAFPYAWLSLVNPVSGNGIVGRRAPLTLSEARYDAMPADIHALFRFEDVRRGFALLDAPLLAKLSGTRLNTDDQPWFFDHPGTLEDERVAWRYLVGVTGGAAPP